MRLLTKISTRIPLYALVSHSGTLESLFEPLIKRPTPSKTLSNPEILLHVCMCVGFSCPLHSVSKFNLVCRYNDSRLFMSILRMNSETALIPESFTSNALKIAALPLDAHGTSLLHAAAGCNPISIEIDSISHDCSPRRCCCSLCPLADGG